MRWGARLGRRNVVSGDFGALLHFGIGHKEMFYSCADQVVSRFESVLAFVYSTAFPDIDFEKASLTT